jgi:hypothetical protein
MCSSNTDDQKAIQSNTQAVSDTGAKLAVAVVVRGSGQPGIEGLANIGMQPTAAPWHHGRRRGS